MTFSDKKTYFFAVAAIAVAAGVFYAATRRFGHDWGDDFAQYLRHALNLLQGLPYKQSHHVVNPRYQIGPEVYPPVFPLLLAPAVRLVGPLDFHALKLVGIGCFALFLGLWGAWLPRATAPVAGLRPAQWLGAFGPLLLIATLCPVLWAEKDRILSDLPYMAVQQLALLAVLYRARESAGWRWQVLGGLALGVALYLPAGCRTSGLLLAGAFGLESVWRGWRRPALLIQPGVALATWAALLFLQIQYLAAHDAGYGQQLRTYFSFAQVAHNAREYWELASRFWEEPTGRVSPLQALAAMAVAGLVGWGWGRQWRARPFQTAELYAVGYLGLILLWPMPQGSRYLLPLLPLGLTYGWLGARALPGRLARLVPTALGLGMAVAGAWGIAHTGPIPAAEQMNQPTTWALVRWCHQQPATTVFLFDKPRLLGLYADRPALVLRDQTDSVALTQDIRWGRARYVIIRRSQSAQLPAHLRPLWQNAAFTVYEFSSVSLLPAAPRSSSRSAATSSFAIAHRTHSVSR